MRYGNTPLHDAIKKGIYCKVRVLLTRNLDLNARNGNGETPLHVACTAGHDTIVGMLLKFNNFVDATSDITKTAICIACYEDRKHVLRRLLTGDNKANCVDNLGDRCLSLATFDGQFLNSPNHNKCCVMSLNVQPKAKVDVNRKDNEGRTPLFVACMLKREEIIGRLLICGSDPNIRTKHGDTPLQIACRRGSEKIVKLLLAAKADVNAANLQGNNPLLLACTGGSDSMVETLIRAKVDIHAQNKCGRTPLHLVCYWGRKDILNILLSYGSNVNAKDKQKSTPLHFACIRGDFEIINTLLHEMADVNAVNNSGKTPYELLTCGISKKQFEMHVVKLFVAGFSIHQKYWKIVHDYYKKKHFLSNCEEEMKVIRNWWLTEDILCTDVLMLNRRKLVVLAKIEEMQNIFNINILVKKFPVYSSILERNFKKGREWRMLADFGRVLVKMLVGHYLPDELCLAVSEYLNETDLRYLKQVFPESELRDITEQQYF